MEDKYRDRGAAMAMIAWRVPGWSLAGAAAFEHEPLRLLSNPALGYDQRLNRLSYHETLTKSAVHHRRLLSSTLSCLSTLAPKLFNCWQCHQVRTISTSHPRTSLTDRTIGQASLGSNSAQASVAPSPSSRKDHAAKRKETLRTLLEALNELNRDDGDNPKGDHRSATLEHQDVC
jgi:hypothetical protein